jgi:peptidylprolyl isomerase
VATSRRRERERARRRFERRRQAEAERRAKQKKRNTTLGAVIGSCVVLAAIAIGTYAIIHHSHHKSGKDSAASTPTTTPTPSTSPTPAPAAPTKCAKVNPNPPAKGDPMVPDVTGKLTDKLVVNDIKKGTGPAAKAGDKVTVKYVGVACSTGKAFDASYTDGAKNQEFSFTLGQGSVIKGWDEGLVGMKAGGQRQLIIPAALAYGAAGSGAIKGNETLNFVVDMVKV